MSNLYPYSGIAVFPQDQEIGGEQRNTKAGAQIRLFDLSNNPVTMYDTSSGGGGSTVKLTDSNGFFIFYVPAGTYRLNTDSVTNVIIRVVGETVDLTTLDIVSNISSSTSGESVTTIGYSVSGDSGGAQWVATSTTGLTASQTPSARNAKELTDPTGRLWQLISPYIPSEAVGGLSIAQSIALSTGELIYHEGELLEYDGITPVNAISNRIGKLNSKNLMKAWEKLSIDNTAVTVVCVGDSMTAGHDAFSPDKITSPYGNPITVAPVQYPISAQTAINLATGNTSSFINRGYSGDTAKNSYNRWTTNPNADVAHIMLGINDSDGVDSATLDEYIAYMQLIIKRHVEWGCGVVLHTATPRQFNALNPKSTRFINAVKRIAKDYSCPVFESDTTVKYTSNDGVYSDSTHFNAHGYNKYGKAVASFIMSGGWVSPINKLSGTQTLLTGETSDGTGFFSRTGVTLTPADGSYMLTRQTGGMQSSNSRMTYTFYMDCEIMDVYGIGQLEGIEISLSKELAPTYVGDDRGPKSINRLGIKGYQNLNIQETTSYVSQPNRSAAANGKLGYIGTLYGRGWKIIDASPSTTLGAQQFFNGIMLQEKSISEVGGYKDQVTGGVVTIGESAVITYQIPYYNNEDTTSTPTSSTLPSSVDIPCPWGLLPYNSASTQFYDHLPVEVVISNTISDEWAKVLIKRVGATALSVQTIATGASGASLVPTGASFSSALWSNATQSLPNPTGSSITGSIENIYLRLSFGATSSSFYSITVKDVRKKGQTSWLS